MSQLVIITSLITSMVCVQMPLEIAAGKEIRQMLWSRDYGFVRRYVEFVVLETVRAALALWIVLWHGVIFGLAAGAAIILSSDQTLLSIVACYLGAVIAGVFFYVATPGIYWRVIRDSVGEAHLEVGVLPHETMAVEEFVRCIREKWFRNLNEGGEEDIEADEVVAAAAEAESLPCDCDEGGADANKAEETGIGDVAREDCPLALNGEEFVLRDAFLMDVAPIDSGAQGEQHVQ